jgi:hydroxymethylglutaryl-CoA reductase
MEKKSGVSGFYKLSPKERLEIVKEFAGLTDEEAKIIGETCLDIRDVDRMIENVIGTLELPFAVATNFRINGRDYLIPMAIEETSVVAAASNAAKMAGAKGGFQTESTEPVMIGQIQVVDVKNPNEAKKRILAGKERLLKLANEQDQMLVKFGGGARDVEVKVLDTEVGPMLRVHLLVDVRDAMGANAVNTMCEALSPLIEEITGGKALLRIISNLAVYRLARAKAVFAKEAIGGEAAVDRIVKAYLFAKNDMFRCATHNKGIMNGIVAVALATGQDHRAIEAGAHAYAAMDGYKPLTKYYKNKEGDLVGEIELPMAVGTIGGATKVHPGFKVGLKILGVKNAKELAEIMAAVGLAQNFAALRALSMEGIQKGHMSLHARNIAVMAGAKGKLVDKVAKQMVEEKNIKMDRAKRILEGLLVSSQ